MWIRTIALRNFRNYDSLDLELNPGFNIFVGSNAQGKTNLLEAIYVLSLSKSYRTARDTELIKHQAAQTRIEASVQRIAVLDLAVTVSEYEPKKLELNRKRTNANSFIGKLNTVLFIPDSLQLVKGSPGERRRFLDIQICQVDPIYRGSLLKYQRVVRQRNSLLKSGYNQRSLLKQLPVWDNQLVGLGGKIVLRRQEALTRLNKISRSVHTKISGGLEELSVIYQPFFQKGQNYTQLSLQEIRDIFFGLVQEKKQQEIRRGYTLVGPHRDDVAFLINGANIKRFGSQGQQRTAVLSYILAEMELMSQETGEYPVVLLDDVMSELDRKRRSFLLSVLNEKVQTILTATNLSGFEQEILKTASVFQIQSGKIF